MGQVNLNLDPWDVLTRHRNALEQALEGVEAWLEKWDYPSADDPTRRDIEFYKERRELIKTRLTQFEAAKVQVLSD